MAGVINVRGMRIGGGIPKICVPVLGDGREEIMTSAGQAVASGADVMEWRADFFLKEHHLEEHSLEEHSLEELESILEALRRKAGRMLLLFTIRTLREGGEAAMTGAEYEQASHIAIASGQVDLIDIELSQEETVTRRLVTAAHKAKVKAVVSSHDFNGTPEKEIMVSRLLRMKELGADIPKLAVTPRNREELLRLLSVTQEICQRMHLGPVITVSMGRMGMPSRCLGEIFGSALTFASAGQPSAPGQIPVEELKILLELLHKCSGSES